MGQAEYASIHIDEDFYEQAVIEHLRDDLGYEELYGPDVRRTTDEYRDVFLPDVLPAALARINPNLPREAIQEAILKMSNVEGGTLEQRNETFNDYLQSGVEVRYFDGQEERDEIVYLLDFDNPDNNDFHVVNQWTFVEYSKKRPDVIAFVNGMPLVMFELKSPSREEVDASDAYLQLRNYMHHIPSMFVPNVFCVMSDMAETRVGTITADEDRFTPWKSVDGDYSDTKNAGFKTMLHGMMEKSRLLDIIKNFVVFNDIGDKVIKILAATTSTSACARRSSAPSRPWPATVRSACSGTPRAQANRFPWCSLRICCSSAWRARPSSSLPIAMTLTTSFTASSAVASRSCVRNPCRPRVART